MTAQPITTNELIIKVNTMDDTVLKNTATGTSALSLLTTHPATATGCMTVGFDSQGSSYCAAFGYGAKATTNGVAIGTNSIGGFSTGTYSVAIGSNAKVGGYQIGEFKYSIAIGAYAHTNANSAIQLGYGDNMTAKTFNVGFYDDTTPTNYTLLDGVTGNIPEARLGNTLITGASDPTTSTVGVLGQLYKNTTSGSIFKCSAIDNTDPNAVVYTWSELLDTSMPYLKNIATNVVGLQIENKNTTGLTSYGLTTYGKNITALAPIGTIVGADTKVIKGYSSAAGVTSVGYGCQISEKGITHIGCGGVNSTAGTFSVAVSTDGQLANIHTYIMMDVDGKIPGERMSLQAAGAPTTSTVGSVGQFYVDTTNQDAYICVSDASSTYTWKKITP